MSHDDHKRGSSKGENGSFAAAARDAVKNYEDWCKEHGKQPETDVEIEFRVGINPGNSLSEYVAILHIAD
jgi:hypothetical protein